MPTSTIFEAKCQLGPGINAFVYVARYGRLTQQDGQLARAVSKYVFDGMQGSERHCFLMFTHCPERLLRKSRKEKEQWLE